MFKPHEADGTGGKEPAENPFKGKTGVTRLIHAFFNSMAGLEDAFRHESAFRQEILLAIFLECHSRVWRRCRTASARFSSAR